MNTQNNTPEHTPRPFGYWLRTVDRLLAREFETAFEAEDATRRDWRLLNLLDGDVVAPEATARLQRHDTKLRGLAERGWIAESGDAWTLTDEGRAAKARLGEAVAGIRAKIADAAPDEDIATTMATLEAIARELGWSPDERMPRGHRHGFGPGRHGRPDCDRRHSEHAHRQRTHGEHAQGEHHHGHHGHDGRRGERREERAYERGFDAGFSRGAASHTA